MAPQMATISECPCIPKGAGGLEGKRVNSIEEVEAIRERERYVCLSKLAGK